MPNAVTEKASHRLQAQSVGSDGVNGVGGGHGCRKVWGGWSGIQGTVCRLWVLGEFKKKSEMSSANACLTPTFHSCSERHLASEGDGGTRTKKNPTYRQSLSGL